MLLTKPQTMQQNVPNWARVDIIFMMEKNMKDPERVCTFPWSQFVQANK